MPVDPGGVGSCFGDCLGGQSTATTQSFSARNSGEQRSPVGVRSPNSPLVPPTDLQRGMYIAEHWTGRDWSCHSGAIACVHAMLKNGRRGKRRVHVIARIGQAGQPAGGSVERRWAVPVAETAPAIGHHFGPSFCFPLLICCFLSHRSCIVVCFVMHMHPVIVVVDGWTNSFVPGVTEPGLALLPFWVTNC